MQREPEVTRSGHGCFENKRADKKGLVERGKLVAEAFPIWKSGLRCSAAGLLSVYVTWNLFWLSQCRLAPSLFESLTGLPCATSGGTRSFFAALDGDWQASLLHNPMTLPILIALFISCSLVLSQTLRSSSLYLPRWLALTWLWVLSFAWCFKIFQWAIAEVA